MAKRKKYIFKVVKASKMDEWLNDKADAGYVLERSWMVSRKGHLSFAVVMHLADLE